jgi:DNA repair exonuclease SbcCD ATPase subunit
MAPLGSERPSLKGDAEEGEVTLEIGDETYDRVLRRSDGDVVFDGDPFVDDPDAADRFAFLLGDNEARLAVERGDDLRDVIMEPIDTATIESEIERLETEKRELREELDRLSSLADGLPELESSKREIEDELESKRSEFQELEAEIEERGLEVDEHRAQKQELEGLFDNLQSEQSELESIEFDLETERETIEDLEAERERLEAELETMDDDHDDPGDLDARIDDLRERKRSLDRTLNELQSVLEFNEAAIEQGGPDLGDVLGSNPGSSGSSDADALTEQLVDDSDDVVCWTCGSDVTAETIETTIEELRSVRANLVQERNELQDEIGSLTEQRDSITERERERKRTERRLSSIDDELEEARARIESLEDDREAAADSVEELEAEVEAFEETDHDEVLEIYREANHLELEVERLESDLVEVKDRIDEVEAEIERRDRVEDRREHTHEQLTELRTRVERIQKNAVESFNDHMESILDTLEYDNIERIWIERREQDVRDGRRTVTETVFDLHVVRATDDGTTYRDTVDHLSESERTVTGLVFALAGFLVHDLPEELPILLLDSLEEIDSDRIAAVVEYLEDFVEYLVVVLLPEDAEAVSDEYDYVSEI